MAKRIIGYTNRMYKHQTNCEIDFNFNVVGNIFDCYNIHIHFEVELFSL